MDITDLKSERMIYSKATLDRWIDKALARYGVTISQIEAEEGEVIKDKKLRKTGRKSYYDLYPFENEEHYEEWKKIVTKEIKNLNKDFDDEKAGMMFDFIDALIGLSQPYLFKTENL